MELRRTRAGQFQIEDAVTLDRLIELIHSDSIAQVLLSPNAALSHLPAVHLDAGGVSRTLNGIDIRVEDTDASHWPKDQPVRMLDPDGQLTAVGIYDDKQGAIHPKVVIGNQK